MCVCMFFWLEWRQATYNLVDRASTLLADNKLSFLVVSLIVVFLATNIEIFKIQ